MMNAQEIIAYIGSAEKKTPVKAYVKERAPLSYGSPRCSGMGQAKLSLATGGSLAPFWRIMWTTSRI